MISDSIIFHIFLNQSFCATLATCCFWCWFSTLQYSWWRLNLPDKLFPFMKMHFTKHSNVLWVFHLMYLDNMVWKEWEISQKIKKSFKTELKYSLVHIEKLLHSLKILNLLKIKMRLIILKFIFMLPQSFHLM